MTRSTPRLVLLPMLALLLLVAPEATAQCEIKLPTKPRDMPALKAPGSTGGKRIDLSGPVQRSDIQRIVRASSDSIAILGDQAMSDPRILKALRKSKITVCVHANGHAEASALLARSVDRVETLAVVPRSAEEIRRTYPELFKSGNGPSMEPLMNQMRNAHEQWKSVPAVDLFEGTAIPHRDRVRKALQSSETDSLMVVFAHNDGTNIRFADGTSMPINEFFKLEQQSARPAVLVSCDTLGAPVRAGSAERSVRTAKRVRYDHAACAMARLMAALASESSVPVEQVLGRFSRDLGPCGSSKRTIAVVSALGGGAIITLYAIDSDDKEKK